MSDINFVKKNLNLNKCSINQNVSDWIEQDIIVPDTKPDAVKIVNVTVTPYVTDVEPMDGKLKVMGKVNYFVIYRVDDERFNTRGLFVTYPYNEILDVPGMTSDTMPSVRPVVKNVIYSLPNERKIAIKSEVMFKIKVKNPVNVNLINRFEDDLQIECKMKEGFFNNIMESKRNIIASKDDVMLPKEAEDFFEILNVTANIKNTEYKESYNKIMVKGDIAVKLVYLSEEKEIGVKTVYLEIPFSAMIELENISDNSKFDIRYQIQDFSLRPNEDITSTKTMIADYQIEVDVTMYEEEDTEYVEDFYSQTQELQYDDEAIEVVSRIDDVDRVIEVRENLTNILPPNTKLIDYEVDTSYITPSINGNVVRLDGNAKVSLLILDLENMEVENKVVDILINEEFSIDNVQENTKVYVDIKEGEATVTGDGQDLDIRLTITVSSELETVNNINVIDNIVQEKLDAMNLDSMNIYIVKPGDTLWSIAKRYKTSVEKIANTNNIENVNSIDVGQKILIIR